MQLSDLAAAGPSPDYQKLVFDYRPHVDQQAARAGQVARHPVVVVGAGPVGLALAIDLAQQKVPVVLLDNDHRLSTGSRAICFSKRSLEIFDRLGCGERMADKGVSWNLGRVFLRDEQIYAFDLLPEAGHERPAFVNLQQYYVEGFLAERAAQLPLIDLRWKNQVVGMEQQADHVRLTIETPDGPYEIEADWVAACDGSRSTLRRLQGQESKGRVFKDRFLIADVRMDVDFPAERWFWFDPAFHPARACCCTASPTVCGASTSSWAGTPTPRRSASPNTSCRACARCSTPRPSRAPSSRWNGPASTPSPVCAWTTSAMAACSSRATRRTACRPSARAVPTRACRTPRTWPGSWPPCCARRRPRRCCRATRRSVNSRPTKTSATPRAPPTSSHPRARSAACTATPCCTWRASILLRARWSTAGGCRCRRC